MASVQGVREKVHLPIYDAIKVKPGEQLRDVEGSSTLKFFVNVQGKTKLETNLQSASLLSHYNTFEARAMRVVISDLPARFSDENDVEITVTGTLSNADGTTLNTPTNPVSGTVSEWMDALEELGNDTLIVTVGKTTITLTSGQLSTVISEIEDALDSSDSGPAPEQLSSNNGSGTVIGKLIYNTVTTLYVGEKEMIKMPTWFFPSGAGPNGASGTFTTHGNADPTATFRFAEPIFVDKQQNFRVEMETPDTETLKEIQKIYGPLFIWVVLDGYMTRDVQ